MDRANRSILVLLQNWQPFRHIGVTHAAADPYERQLSKQWMDIDEQDEADATGGNEGNDG